MALRDEHERTGRWLFRWRSYLPLALIPPVLAAAIGYRWPLNSEPIQDVWEAVCMAISFAGLGVRVLTIGFAPSGTSGRNTLHQVASQLNTTGMYSIVRHPLYFGNFLLLSGAILFFMNVWLMIVFVLAYWLYYDRIMLAEESFLREKFGAAFESWAAVTPTFIPNPRLWKTPDAPFSLRTVIRREYTTIGAIGLLYMVLDLIEHWITEDAISPGPVLTTVCLLCMATYLVLRVLKKATPFLNRQRPTLVD